MRVGYVARHVRSIGCVLQAIGALISIDRQTKRKSGLHGPDAGYFPTSEYGAGKGVLRVA